jgi:hypothetical protein
MEGEHDKVTPTRLGKILNRRTPTSAQDASGKPIYAEREKGKRKKVPCLHPQGLGT